METDYLLGALTDWPPQSALLLLDGFAPEDRSNQLDQAAHHGHIVSILRLDQPPQWTAVDIRKLQELKAERLVDLPAKSRVHHNAQCWSAAKWDLKRSRYSVLVTFLNSGCCVHPWSKVTPVLIHS